MKLGHTGKLFKNGVQVGRYWYDCTSCTYSFEYKGTHHAWYEDELVALIEADDLVVR